MPTHRAILPHLVTATFLNVAAVLLGTAIGVTLGRRLAAGLQRQVLAGLGLVFVLAPALVGIFSVL